MDYDKNKVDEMTLALLYLVKHGNKDEERAWKGFDWETMNRLHEKGLCQRSPVQVKICCLCRGGCEATRGVF